VKRRSARGDLAGSALSAAMALQFSVVVILGHDVQAGAKPFPMLAMRFAGQSLLLFAVLVLLRKPLVPAEGERVPLAIAGIVGYGSEAALYFSALNHGKAGAVTLLFYLYPVWVMLAAIALDGRAPAALLFVALALALGGSAIVIVAGGTIEVQPLGIALAIATSVAYASYLTFTDRTVKRTDPIVAAAWIGAGAALANVMFSFAFDAERTPTASSWPSLVAMALFSAGAFAAMLGGLQLVGAVRNAIIGVMEPLTVALLAALFLDEPIAIATAIGGVLILGAAVLATVARPPRIDPEVAWRHDRRPVHP
jgi:drug/metabolite transporter (DMT)-like permease